MSTTASVGEVWAPQACWEDDEESLHFSYAQSSTFRSSSRLSFNGRYRYASSPCIIDDNVVDFERIVP
jgi:hypothetical protein